MRRHESPLISQGVIRRGPGRGQWWTICLHPDCGKAGTGHLIAVDAMPALARLSADAHLATHQPAHVAS
jgi:hypothetical protein